MEPRPSAAGPGDTPPGRGALASNPYAIVAIRDFRLFLLARFIAAMGQQMLTVAVGWELYERTGSALALGLVGLTQMIPMFALTLPAGHLADNRSRQGILLAMVLTIAAASGGLAAISMLGADVVWMYVCLAGAGCARTFLWPASQAFLPQLVPRELFSRAVTWNTGAFHLSSVIGPAAGGAILALTHRAWVIYLINALFGVTCFLLISRVRPKPVQLAREPMSVRSLLAGFRFVYSTPIILGTITLDLFAVLLGGATALLPVFAKDILHAGPSGLGILQAALPMGSVLCALVLAHRPSIERAGPALLWSVVVFGVATIVFGYSRSFWLSFAMLFICGAFDNVSVVIRHTLVQVLTPDATRGRVSAVNSLFIGTSNELGGFESGVVAHWFGPVFSVVSGGVGTLVVVAVVAWVWPEIRRYGRLDGAADSS